MNIESPLLALQVTSEAAWRHRHRMVFAVCSYLGYIATTAHLIDARATIIARTGYGKTALHLACSK